MSSETDNETDNVKNNEPYNEQNHKGGYGNHSGIQLGSVAFHDHTTPFIHPGLVDAGLQTGVNAPQST